MYFPVKTDYKMREKRNKNERNKQLLTSNTTDKKRHTQKPLSCGDTGEQGIVIPLLRNWKIHF